MISRVMFERLEYDNTLATLLWVYCLVAICTGVGQQLRQLLAAIQKTGCSELPHTLYLSPRQRYLSQKGLDPSINSLVNVMETRATSPPVAQVVPPLLPVTDSDTPYRI